MLRALAVLVVVAAVVAAALVALGDDDGGTAPAVTAATTSAATVATGQRPPVASPSRPPALRPARCAAGAANCAAATGQVVAIESVDADGDGDLHVIAAGGSVTAPGITVFDVRAELRPRSDPRPGDRVTGAGPVYRGRFGQRQIEVVEFRVARR